MLSCQQGGFPLVTKLSLPPLPPFAHLLLRLLLLRLLLLRLLQL